MKTLNFKSITVAALAALAIGSTSAQANIMVDAVEFSQTETGQVVGKTINTAINAGSVATIAMPAAVYTASSLGVAASTGTAISALSGAAATTATAYAVGSVAAPALAVVGIVAAPVVIGTAIIVGTVSGTVAVITWLWD